MRTRLILPFLLAATACATPPGSGPASGRASAIWIGGVKFTPMAGQTGAFAATLDGASAAAAPYTIRVHIVKGGKILPHTHPDARLVTVVDGELCYGCGAVFDENGCKLYPEGSYFVVPANTPHYGFGKTGDAVYQESGVGPSAFVPVPAPAK